VRYTIERSGTQYYVRLKGDNGETMATTERYTTKASAQHVINVIKREASTAPTTDNA
jgi:uncharacterized protein YegP (UPF0339 family)